MQALQLSSSNRSHSRHLRVCIKGRLLNQATRAALPRRGASATTGRRAAVAGSAAAVTDRRGLLQLLLPAPLQTRVSHPYCALSLAGHHDTSQENGSCKRLPHITAVGHCYRDTSSHPTALM